MNQPRKIIQISATNITRDHNQPDTVYALFALCDDATLWVRTPDRRGDPHWRLVADIPQIPIEKK